ncbi:hypothetical protein KC953_01625 [Candidatus Saccharibacteria bacterium]|nr:hypothetical protein [Candidatus Saccharibacteria bacterium]
MKHHFYHFHARTFLWRRILTEEMLSFLLVFLVLVAPASAITRLQERSLLMYSSAPGATTSYKVSFGYLSTTAVGSIDMLVCYDPIPYMPCVTPTGFDMSHATLSDQSGEGGFGITTQTTNHIILSRPPSMPVASGLSSYTLSGVVNPTDNGQSFSIRLRTHSTIDATGSQIDAGSVRGRVTNEGVVIETQVPPMLIFCLARQVDDFCTGTDDTYYTDMGELSSDSTLTAQSQMAVGTNASGGFAITASGTPLAAGTNVIDSPDTPTESKKGTNQFGINLVANNEPVVGEDPDGPFANAVASSDYSVPNKYKFVSGDVVAYSPNVSLMKKFTVSYIVNSSEDLRAGVYTTTITYLASGRF